jgi:hypothetical protein
MGNTWRSSPWTETDGKMAGGGGLRRSAVGIRRRRREREDGVCRCVSGVEREREGLKHRFYRARRERGRRPERRRPSMAMRACDLQCHQGVALDEGKRKE